LPENLSNAKVSLASSPESRTRNPVPQTLAPRLSNDSSSRIPAVWTRPRDFASRIRVESCHRYTRGDVNKVECAWLDRRCQNQIPHSLEAHFYSAKTHRY